jgi:hypothetical protein
MSMFTPSSAPKDAAHPAAYAADRVSVRACGVISSALPV